MLCSRCSFQNRRLIVQYLAKDLLATFWRHITTNLPGMVLLCLSHQLKFFLFKRLMLCMSFGDLFWLAQLTLCNLWQNTVHTVPSCQSLFCWRLYSFCTGKTLNQCFFFKIPLGAGVWYTYQKMKRSPSNVEVLEGGMVFMWMWFHIHFTQCI